MNISQISINNAEKLSFKSRFELFNGSIAFKRVSEFTLSLVFSDITTQDGDLIDFTDLLALQNREDYNIFSVNGIELQKAKIKSFQVEGGNFNKNALVTIILEVQEEAEDLTALVGYYADYAAGFTESCAFVDELSESINISRGENTTEFSKQVDVKFSNSALLVGDENPLIRQAQNFAKAIFDYDWTNGYSTIPDLDSEDNIRDSLANNKRKTTSETLDAINNRCSFRQNLRIENAKSSPVNYSHSATQRIQIDQNGIATVSERGKIEALEGFYKTQSNIAETAYSHEVGQARTRVQEIFDQYYECVSPSLNTQSGDILFIRISKNVDPYGGIITYDLTATNDPKYENADDSVMYSTTLTYSISNNIWTATERGSIEGLSQEKYNSDNSGLDRYPSYKMCYDFYNSILASTIKARIQSFIQDMGCTDTISPEVVSRSETHSPLVGRLEYERSLSTDPKYLQNDSWKSITATSSSKYEFLKKNDFLIINKPFLVQTTSGNTRGGQSISVDILGYRINPALSSVNSNMALIKQKAIDEADSVKESGSNFTERISSTYSFFNDVRFGLSAEVARGMDSV